MRSDPRGLSVRGPGLTAAHRAFDRWRRSASAGRSRRIPLELWERARELAQAHGVSRTTRELGLDYYALAKRVQATEGRGGRGSGVNEASAFVELTIPAVVAPPRGPSCRLEQSDGGGTRLCVELSGAGAREIEALARGLWSAAR